MIPTTILFSIALIWSGGAMVVAGQPALGYGATMLGVGWLAILFAHLRRM